MKRMIRMLLLIAFGTLFGIILAEIVLRSFVERSELSSAWRFQRPREDVADEKAPELGRFRSGA